MDEIIRKADELFEIDSLLAERRHDSWVIEIVGRGRDGDPVTYDFAGHGETINLAKEDILKEMEEWITNAAD
jgi:hypothetical protein